jgi:eukaryotic-like serine/threonine-protein kinase
VSEPKAEAVARGWQVALQGGALRMERTVVKAGLLLSSAGTLIAIVHGALTVPHPGIIGLALTVLAWESFALVLLTRDIGTRVLAWVDPVIESLFPTALMWVEAVTVDARAATFFTAGPVMYMYSVLLSVVRLRLGAPALSAAVGASSYGALLYFVLIPRALELGPISADERVFLYMRLAFLALGGAMGTFVVASLRRVAREAHADVRAQDLFGKYRIGEEIASGGMGVVMRATYCPEGGFERDVAMKRIHPHLVKDPQLVSSFRAEAELSARMLHPNIVQVLDFGRVEDTWFYAMEYVEGFTLHEAIKACRTLGTTIPLPVLAYIGREVCAGLDYAHRGALGVDGRPLNVVHRDLTPSNILLARTGQVKIADFGVAKALKGASAHHTQTMAGKIPYMAPEQASGGAVDGRTDLFTLGIVLWEAIANRMLFYRDNEAATLHAVLNQPVHRPSEVRPDVPTAWDGVVLKALAREPSARFASAEELSDALAPLSSAGPTELAAFLAGLPRTGGRELATPHAGGRSMATTMPHGAV